VSGAATPRADPSDLPATLRDFVGSQAGHGIQAVSLEVVQRSGQPVISGRVLTFRQARDLRRLAGRHGATVSVEVVADPTLGLEEGWLEASVEVLDVWRDPGRAGQEAARQTQYLASDGPLRGLGAEAGWALVQGPDLAIGWAAARDLRETDAGSARRRWETLERAAEDASRPPAGGPVSPREVIARARAELDVPYVWGGTTHAGFDCSGLIQRVLLETTGVLLPRHTGDQRRVGSRVLGDDVRPGDLLFATPRAMKVGHVLLMTSGNRVLHACRTEHRVIEEGLEANAARYRHQGWRRPLQLGR
jgi:murein DD-endopeptidase